jgi:radical SAM superfamily enzyme YgiQ (UPF0313 family)
MKKQLSFIVMPNQEVERPPAAAGAIASILKDSEYELTILDLNLWLYNMLDKDLWLQFSNYWKIDHVVDDGITLDIDKWFRRYLNTILRTSPDLIAISVFTKWGTRSTIILCKLLKELAPDIPVVVGGNGLSTPYRVNSISDTTNFAQYLSNNNLITDYIMGEGEVSFLEYLKGNINYPGINNQNQEQINNLDNIPFPNYSKLLPSNYFPMTDYGVYITGSRGCVRKCTFCDVPWRWPKFKYRSGSNIAKEMFEHYKNYKVNIFQFTDSLINGNVREFNSMNESLSEFKQQDSNFNPKYMGQFICRPKKYMTEDVYRKMKTGGCESLFVGIEHGSEQVRTHMKKEFTNSDIDHHFEQCGRFGITNVVLMFVGYPTETLKDHEENINFLYKYKKYAQAGIISMIRLGYTGSLDLGSPLANNNTDLSLVKQKPNLDLSHLLDQDQDWVYGRNWINLNNPDLTLEERIRRRLEMHKHAVNLGYNQPRTREELYTLKKILWEFQEKNTNKEKSHIPLFTESADAHD